MKKHIGKRGLAALLSILMVVSMFTVCGFSAMAATTDEVIAAIDAIGTDEITKANFNTKSAAIDAAQATYDEWKAQNEDVQDSAITNCAALQTAQTARREFLSDLTAMEYKTYAPEELLAIAQETSVTGATSEEMVGVEHTGAVGALYENLVTPYLGIPEYSYEEKESYKVDSAEADAAYVYEFTGATNGNSRFCDTTKYLIYQFDLSKFQNLCVEIQVAQNYILEVSADPVNGPWTVIADYSGISGGTRIEGDANKTYYDIVFSAYGITGTGYVRVRNTDTTKGWGGSVLNLKLKEATLVGDSFLVNPGNRLSIEVDVDITGADAEDKVLDIAIANGSYSQSASITGAELAELDEQISGKYGYSYRTISMEWRLPTAADDAALAEALKTSGFDIDIRSDAAVSRKIYRIAVVNVNTEETLFELSGQELLDAAVAASAPAAYEIIPSAYQAFESALAIRSAEGSNWYSVLGLEAPYLDESGEPFFHAGDEVMLSVDLFYEGTDSDDLAGGNGARLECYLNGIESSIGLEGNSSIVSVSEYNDAELMIDEIYEFEPYKTVSKTFVIPEDTESEELMQTTPFTLRIGTHVLPKEDAPLRIYSAMLLNVTTSEVVLYADADTLSATSHQDTRETMYIEDAVGGIAGMYGQGYNASVLINGGFETLTPGMYSYDFYHALAGNYGSNYATLSVVTESGDVLTGMDLTEITDGKYNTDRLTFSVSEETSVGFKIDLYNSTNYYLKNITLNQMLSASEVAIQKIINAIEALPTVEELTLDDAVKVASAQRQYDRLEEDEKAKVTNADKLTQATDKITELEEQAEADAAAAKAVDDTINALPAIADLAKADKSKVEEARSAYVGLNERQQPLVTALATLEAAEARMTLLDAATDDEIAAAKAADTLIAALPTVDALTYEDAAKVSEARAAYDALSEKAAALILNLDTLTAAEARIAELTPEYTLGKVNDDDKIDASDALMALQHSVQLITLEGSAFSAANVNGDGKVDAADALLILQYSVELIEKFPIE